MQIRCGAGWFALRVIAERQLCSVNIEKQQGAAPMRGDAAVAASRHHDSTLRAASVSGRISMFLENAERYDIAPPPPRPPDRREEMRATIESPEEALGDDVQPTGSTTVCR